MQLSRAKPGNPASKVILYVLIIIENNNYKQYNARVIHRTDRRNCVIGLCLFRRVLSNMTIPY